MTTDGVGERYRGTRGCEYYAYQSKIGEIGGQLNLFKFVEHVSPEMTVIDFGCGAGALLSRLNASRKVAVEPNAVARQEAERRGIEVVPRAADLPSEFADVVISNHALEHTLNPYSELIQLWRALKPGGSFVCWLPLDDWRAQRDAFAVDPNGHVYTWTPLLLRNLLEGAGFVVRDCRVVTSAWSSKFIWAQRRLPSAVYHSLEFLLAVVLRRRQLCAVAQKPSAHLPIRESPAE